MTEHDLLALATVVVCGVLANWISWRLRLPSILLLLFTGFLLGPITGVLHPDDLLGDLLMPVVSLSVGLILYEGGLSLRLAELRDGGTEIRNLVTIGAAVTWIGVVGAALWLLKMDIQLASLLGAVLIVTGPTVIGPLLRHIRPVGAVGPILKWEGIVIDPIGATLAVLIFEAILIQQSEAVPLVMIWGVIRTFAVGASLGLVGAAILVLLLRRHWLPDLLQNPMSIVLALAAFTAADLLQPEAGLLAVTIMGLAVGNQKLVPIGHILEFKETLRVLLIGSLFILLSARLRLEALLGLGVGGVLFVLALVLIVRPAAVFLATLRSGLSLRQRLFLAWMAPRGIVAAAVSSVFALRLAEAGIPGAEALVPVTFGVIVGTVAVYGLTAAPVARWLGVALSDPQGLLIVGAHAWARDLAQAVQGQGLRALMVDTNEEHVSLAHGAGLEATQANVLDEDLDEALDLGGIGYLMACTPNAEVNALAALHFRDTFGRSAVYQLPPPRPTTIPKGLRGRFAFSSQLTFDGLSTLVGAGAVIEVIPHRRDHPSDPGKGEGNLIPLLAISPQKRLTIVTGQSAVSDLNAQTVIGLRLPANDNDRAPERTR